MSASKGWCFLRALVIFFIIGYLVLLAYFLLKETVQATDTLVSVIMFFGSVFVVIVSRFSLMSLKELQSHILAERHNALHDALTKLPNRLFFKEYLATCQQSGKNYYLCLLDLNDFKQINDGIGHYYGDEVLRTVASKTTQSVVQEHKFFRLGGDEFALLAECVDDTEFADLAKVIQENFANVFHFDNYELSISVSIGAIKFNGNNSTPDELLKKADLALYSCKQTRHPYCVFNQSLQQAAERKLFIAAELKIALAERNLLVWYQPIVDAQTKQIVAAEALLRWQQSDGSFIRPDEFIPIAETDATINSVTHYLLEQVADDLEYFSQQGLTIPIHINLSAKDIYSFIFHNKVKLLLSQGRIKPESFVFEITETAMMSNIELAQEMLTSLKNIGFVLSIDDFGTGFSSLSLLRHLPISQIKIDRSFVHNLHKDPANCAIVKSTIFLAQSLDCTIVAEGIENEETSLLVSQLGCQFLQGFLYAKPCGREPFVTFFNSWPVASFTDITGNLASASSTR